jgi:hypothetical protein
VPNVLMWSRVILLVRWLSVKVAFGSIKNYLDVDFVLGAMIKLRLQPFVV